MIIVYVIDSYGKFSNGTTVTAKRSKKHLEQLGHTIRIVSIDPSKEEGFFELEERKIPIVSKVAKKQHMHFAKPCKKTYYKAFEGADLIHLFLPFKSSLKAIKVAKELNIPVTSAFHMQPEHITYGMGLGRYGSPVAWIIYKYLKFRFYNKVTRIHCPSEFIRDKLKKNNYNNICHVISNGVLEEFYTNPKRELKPKQYNILSIGRYSKEKRQETLLKAISKSKYKDKIKITLAGKGPREKYLKRLSKKLNLNVEFVFLSKEELIEKIKDSHLYIHTAEAEIEGISALEAIASGLVPIIAISKNSATTKFTLTEESRFKVRDDIELKDKIEYFIEDPKRRVELEEDYRKHMKLYQIDNSMLLLEEMFKEAIKDHNRHQATKTKKGKKKKLNVSKNRFKRFFSFIFYFFIATPILSFYFHIIRGVKFKGKKNKKHVKSGAIVISNHVHSLDSAMNAIAMFPKKLNFTTLPQNIESKLYGPIVSALGASPIPLTPLENKVYSHEYKTLLKDKRYIQFFPEGYLNSGDKTIRNFKRGAFVLAVENKVPIIPIRIKYKNKKWYRYPFFFKKKIEVVIGSPIHANIFINKRDAIKELMDDSYNKINNM